MLLKRLHCNWNAIKSILEASGSLLLQLVHFSSTEACFSLALTKMKITEAILVDLFS